jgi:hypothetical protein
VTLGVSTEVSAHLVDDDGMVNPNEFEYLTPKDVDQLIIYLMRNSGTRDVILPGVPQVGVAGDTDFVAAFPGHMHEITNRWHPVPVRAVMNITLLVFWLKNQRFISCVPAMTVPMVPTLRAWRNQVTFEGGHMVTATRPVINDNHWPKTLDYLSEYLAANLGEQDNPLYYVIRPQVDVPRDTYDPSTGYETVDWSPYWLCVSD